MGYLIQLRINDNIKVIEERFVELSEPRKLVFKGLLSSVEYEVAGVSVCRNTWCRKLINLNISQHSNDIKSDPAFASFVTHPKPPLNLRLENAQAASLKVKWDAPNECFFKPGYTVSLRPLDEEVIDTLGDEIIKDVEGTVYTFTKLPDVIGSGKKYEIEVKTTINVGGKILESDVIKKVFTTKPLPPELLKIINSNCQEFSWKRCQTKDVKKYKFKIKKDDERPIDYFIDDNIISEESDDCNITNDCQLISFRVPTKFEEGSDYKINVYSLLDIDNNCLESEPCQARVSRLYENCEV